MPFNEFFKRFLTVFIVLLLWAGLWAARSTILMGVASAFIAIALSIPARWLQNRGWRRPWALAATIVGVLLAAIVLILWLVPPLLEEFGTLLNTIPAALDALVGLYTNLRNSNSFLQTALPAPPQLSTEGIDPATARTLLSQFLSAGLAIAPRLLGGVSELLTVLINLAFVLFITVFFLTDSFSYVKAILYLTPQRYHKRVIDILNELYFTIRTWVSTLFLSISITMMLVWLILGVLLDMPNALVVAVFAGIATFIPNIGAIIPVIPVAIFTLDDDPSQLLVRIAAYLLIQLTESNILTPSLVKAELDIPAGGLMIFQLLMTFAFGALGLLLAVPILSVLIVLVREIFSYDLLGLRHLSVKLDTDKHGNLELHEHEIESHKTETGLLPDVVPTLPGSEADVSEIPTSHR